MYKEDLALDNLQWLICHKTKPNLWLRNFQLIAVAITDSPTNAQYALVQAMIVTDCNLKKKKNGKIYARWSYHCHLPKFTT